MARVSNSMLATIISDGSLTEQQKEHLREEMAANTVRNRKNMEAYWRKRVRAEIQPEIEKLKSEHAAEIDRLSHELAEEKRYLEMAEDECSTLRAALALAEKVTP